MTPHGSWAMEEVVELLEATEKPFISQ